MEEKARNPTVTMDIIENNPDIYIYPYNIKELLRHIYIMARYLLIHITNVIDKNPYYYQNKFPHVQACIKYDRSVDITEKEIFELLNNYNSNKRIDSVMIISSVTEEIYTHFLKSHSMCVFEFKLNSESELMLDYVYDMHDTYGHHITFKEAEDKNMSYYTYIEKGGGGVESIRYEDMVEYLKFGEGKEDNKDCEEEDGEEDGEDDIWDRSSNYVYKNPRVMDIEFNKYSDRDYCEYDSEDIDYLIITYYITLENAKGKDIRFFVELTNHRCNSYDSELRVHINIINKENEKIRVRTSYGNCNTSNSEFWINSTLVKEDYMLDYDFLQSLLACGVRLCG